MRFRCALMIACALLFSFPCTGSAATPAATPAAATSPPVTPPNAAAVGAGAAVLLAVDARFAALVAERGFAAFGDFFADDAVHLPMYAPMLQGHAAIMSAFQPLIADPSVRLSWKPLRGDMAKSGDLGWTTGSYEVTIQGKDGGTIVRHGKYVTIWKKQADGAWKAVLDGGNPDEPPA